MGYNFYVYIFFPHDIWGLVYYWLELQRTLCAAAHTTPECFHSPSSWDGRMEADSSSTAKQFQGEHLSNLSPILQRVVADSEIMVVIPMRQHLMGHEWCIMKRWFLSALPRFVCFSPHFVASGEKNNREEFFTHMQIVQYYPPPPPQPTDICHQMSPQQDLPKKLWSIIWEPWPKPRTQVHTHPGTAPPHPPTPSHTHTHTHTEHMESVSKKNLKQETAANGKIHLYWITWEFIIHEV